MEQQSVITLVATITATVVATVVIVIKQSLQIKQVGGVQPQENIKKIDEILEALHEHKNKCVRCNDHQDIFIEGFKELSSDFYDARNLFVNNYQNLINQLENIKSQLEGIADAKPNAAIEKALIDVCATINQLSGSIDQISRNSNN